MSGGGFRLGSGGLVDRARPLAFAFDGRPKSGFSGDTLASALLAGGARVVGRSFKYHRPRGVFAAGHEEPNALVELRQGARREPNVKATTVELFDGLDAASQNRWPSLDFDALAVNGLLKPVFAAGFYYKTFMWPASFWEKLYEPAIRRAAGLGRASGLDDPDSYERANLHCDLLIVGAGPAGLAAALAAARSGARVVLCEDDFRLGGGLLDERGRVGGGTGPQWADAAAAELAALPDVRVLSRTSVVAAYDGGTFAAVERVADHLLEPPPFTPRQRFWRVVARRAVLATGATERPLVFPDNDRPGVMLAGAARRYLNRFGVAVGRRVVIHTTTDQGWVLARDLIAAGLPPVAVVEARREAPAGFADVAKAVPVVLDGAVVATRGRKGLKGVTVRAGAATQDFEADALAVSGGFNPAIQLASGFRGRPEWSDALQAFLAPPVAGLRMAGAAAGAYTLKSAFESGVAAAQGALRELGLTATPAALPEVEESPASLAPCWRRPGPKDSKAFVDLQHDVTASDVVLAHREGYRAAEHLKRYTTLGMATDQGRTSNLDALAVMAQLTGRSIPETGVTLARPPAVPIALGAVAGAHRGASFRPVRETPVHRYAIERGATFVDVGQWKRPQLFPLPQDADAQAGVTREVNAVRAGAGVTDVSTLGKIEVEGADAAAFLDFVCATRVSRIRVGRCGYFAMLREDGFLKDDGMIARFAPDRFLAFVSTAHAGPVYRHMHYCRQVLRPDLDVNLTAVTDAWVQLAIAGEKAPDVVQALVDAPTQITQAAFPPMTAAEVTICGGVPARLCALSFSGERAFELAAPAFYGDALIRRVVEAGAPFGLVAYGADAMGVMRIEKGHPAGGEINGQTTAYDLGLARALDSSKDHVGRVLSGRPALNDPARPRLVGVRPLASTRQIRAGAHVVAVGAAPSAATDLGWVSSACWSPTLASWIGLAMVSGGPERIGETVRLYDPVRGGDVEAEITPPCVFDPGAGRTRADAPPAPGAPPTRPGLGPARAPLGYRPGRYGPAEGPAGVTLGLADAGTRLNIEARKGRARDLLAAIGRALGAEPVDAPRTVSAGGGEIFGIGPSRWHAVFRGEDSGARARTLTDAARDAATVVDVTHGFVVYRLAGAHARKALARLVRVDLDARVFAPGACVQTELHGMGAQLRRTPDGEAFECAVSSSFAGSLLHALIHAAQAYRLDVEPLAPS
ncbi:sarcosine oxidase subunit alpha family protein [Methylocella sp.]|uniref:sarcosine oxidase subunit alpha family protein n=1 Tax=Methylocella sp. TaxID=1978226 RepID=UPI0037832D25